MSKPNKTNKNNYTQAGRLTPDDMARARRKQSKLDVGRPREQAINRADDQAPGGGAPASSRPRSAPEE